MNSTGSSVPSEKVNQSLCWTLKPKASKTMNKEQDVIDTGKRSMTPNKVKLVYNIIKHPQTFLKKSPVQMEDGSSSFT